DSLTQRPVADEDRRDRAAALLTLGERHPGGHRHRAAEDAVRVEVAGEEVLAPALAAADAADATHHLAEQAVDVVGEGEIVAVAAVVRDHDVALGLEAR